MAERIVSPGVFTRERDLSFLPQGVSEIGAAIVGPTVKGPSFVPTVVRNFEEFESIFGTYNSDYYTPFTVKNYLDSAGTVTIVKVGYLGGYKVSGFNLVASGSGDNASVVVAQFLPAKPNNSGEGLISGSLGASVSASSFTLTINGANATASVSGLTIQESGTATGNLDVSQNFIAKSLPSSPSAQKIGSTDAPAYMYKFFRTSISASFASGKLSPSSSLSIENFADGVIDFSTGTESVDTSDGNYISTISGNSDASAARTPFILAQDSTELFKIYTRADGTETNNHYVVIRDIKRPQNSNSSPDYAEFGLAVYTADGSLVESYSNLNMDPTSGNYIVKVIGDEFQTVNNDGEITVYGDYPNASRHIRVGDYKEDTFTSNPALQPMGFSAALDPIKSTAGVPSASFNRSQTFPRVSNEYKEDLPYGFMIDSRFGEDELATNKAYLSPIPKSENAGLNANFLLSDMKGFGEAGSSEASKYTNFAIGTVNLSISSSAQQLKYAVPFQHGFDGINPSHPKQTGTSISSANTSGFDISSATASGSIAYKRAINAVSNPDEYDINMLVTPGIIHKHHNIITNHAIDKVEARADAFYVMDSSDIDDNVATAVNNIANLDTNYVATYYPWVKMDDISRGSGTVLVPPSVVIPGVIAFTDSVAHEWFAPAGLNRGGLTNVRATKKKLTHTDRDTLYEGRVNPIASFPGQGVVVFGQKTLQARPSALDRINVRRLLIRLKKFIASSSRFLVFEQNDSSTRSRFLNIVNPFLESVQSNSGLSAFKVVMDDSNNTPDVIDRNQLVGQIFIQPTRTAEFIVLDFSVLPTGAAFPE
ncbi:phage tail sheath subtilisin-like domain-containing protein [bacterium]|nr:phage tail sheath subtilisin-like domain-containing protein [bacterium]